MEVLIVDLAAGCVYLHLLHTCHRKVLKACHHQDITAQHLLDSVQEIHQILQASDVRQEGAPAPTAADFKAATGAQHQIQEWQAQHQDMLHTDVMQAMDESSDSESMIVESNQVNMHASSSALGSFHAPATDDFSKASDPIKLRETSEGKAERHGPKGFFSMLTRALKRS